MPRYQAELSTYEDGRPDDGDVVEKFPLEYPGPEPADRVFGLLISLRREIEDAHASKPMPDADLPHQLHPPNLLPRQERGYRLINRWETELKADERVDDAWLERSYDAEKSHEYGKYVTVEIITLHIQVGSFVIQLTPDGVDRVVTGQETIWTGEVFMQDPTTPFSAQLDALDSALSALD